MPPFVRYALIGLLLVALQWLILGNLKVVGAYPDAVLLFVAWLAIRYGRRAGLIAGFALGLLLDAVYDTWGLQMFVKTLVGFLVGLFPSSERETLLILPQQAFLGGLVIALLHNGLLVTLETLAYGAPSATFAAIQWLGSSFYTALVSLIAALFVKR